MPTDRVRKIRRGEIMYCVYGVIRAWIDIRLMGCQSDGDRSILKRVRVDVVKSLVR